MRLLNQTQLDEVARAIEQVERESDAELVTVLASRADDYVYISTLYAAVLALLMPLLLMLTPFWLDADELLFGQWLLFIGAALLFRVPVIMMRLVPKQVKHWRAANLARRQFLDNNLHHTKGETGVLIFVSEAERYVEIIADRGINQHVSHEQWQQIVMQFTTQVKAGQTLAGFIACIESCGSLLKQHAPATSQKNELPNRLVVLG